MPAFLVAHYPFLAGASAFPSALQHRVAQDSRFCCVAFRGQGRQLGAIGVIDTVVEMNRRSMLPAIIFIFSRQDCDAAVRSMCTAGLNLASDAERTGIEELVDDLRRNQPEAVRENAVKVCHPPAVIGRGRLQPHAASPGLPDLVDCVLRVAPWSLSLFSFLAGLGVDEQHQDSALRDELCPWRCINGTRDSDQDG